MRDLVLQIRQLQLKKRLDPTHYKNTARRILKSINKNDANFKYFFMEFIDQTKDIVDLSTLRDMISLLQRHISLRINKEQAYEDGPDIIRNKIKYKKKERKYL